ncbi:MAG: cytochrome c [Paracoccaceae bacterium]
MKMAPFLISICAVIAMMSSVAAQDAENGRVLYQRHCATCHGEKATGSGPMSPALLLLPPDLTGLERRNGNEFPVKRVVMRIDGRDPLVSHGSPMPVYGDFFQGEEISLKTETGQPILTPPAVVDLVAYLRGVQNRPGTR